MSEILIALMTKHVSMVFALNHPSVVKAVIVNLASFVTLGRAFEVNVLMIEIVHWVLPAKKPFASLSIVLTIETVHFRRGAKRRFA